MYICVREALKDERFVVCHALLRSLEACSTRVEKLTFVTFALQFSNRRLKVRAQMQTARFLSPFHWK